MLVNIVKVAKPRGTYAAQKKAAEKEAGKDWVFKRTRTYRARGGQLHRVFIFVPKPKEVEPTLTDTEAQPAAARPNGGRGPRVYATHRDGSPK